MIGRVLKRLGGWLRDGWIAIGIAFLILFSLEATYRGLQRARHGPPVEQRDQELPLSPDHPYYGQSWFAQLKPGLDARKNKYDPYRSHWPGPVTSRYVNIDSTGRRFTPQTVPDTGKVLQVLMLGGSTMWGYTVRDSATIPALTAKRLHESGIRNVHVTNLAQAAYNSTQEATTLMLEVARGRIPDLVVVLNGYNDVATGLKYRDPGHVFNEEIASQRIEMGRRSFWEEVVGFGRYLHFVAGLQSKVKRGPPPSEPLRMTYEQTCDATARYYAGITRQVEAIGAAHGFPVIYFQQPHHSTTRKPLTSWERAMPNAPRWKQCLDSIDAAMADRVGRSYYSLSDTFDGDSATVFVDAISHLTEAANVRIAERIVEAIAPLLRNRPPR